MEVSSSLPTGSGLALQQGSKSGWFRPTVGLIPTSLSSNRVRLAGTQSSESSMLSDQCRAFVKMRNCIAVGRWR